MDIITADAGAGSDKVTAQIERIADVLRLGVPVVRHGTLKHPKVLNNSVEVLAERVTATAAALGFSVPEFGQLCRRHLGIAWLLPETAAMKMVELSYALGIEVSGVRKVLRANAMLLLRNAVGIKTFVATGAQALGISREAWQAALVRSPSLFNLSVDTIRANLDALADGMSIAPEQIVTAAMRNPPLLYQTPEQVLGRLNVLAQLLDVSLRVVVQAFCIAPSLATREPAGMASRARLCVRLARNLGTPLIVTDLLRTDGTALTYGIERLRRRYLLVRLGVWHGSWRTVLYWSDARLRASMVRQLELSVHESRHTRRLAAVIGCMDGLPA